MTTVRAVGAATALSTRTVWAFASAALTLQGIGVVLAVYLPQHLVSQLGLELAAVGAAFAIVRLVDIPVDPLLGVAIDRTETRWGRYRLFMLVGLPMLTGAVFFLFLAKPGVSILQVAVLLFILYVGHSTVSLAHVAWGAKVATTYDDRSRVFGVLGAVSVIGMTLLLATPMLLDQAGVGGEGRSIPAMGWFLLIATPVSVLLSVLAVKEARQPAALSGERTRLRDYAEILRHPEMLRIVVSSFLFTFGTVWEGSVFLFFMTDARGWTIAEASFLLMVVVAVGLVGAPAVGRLAMRVGKHRAMWIITSAYAAAMACIALGPAGSRLSLWAPLMICGLLYSGFPVLTRAMTADVADDILLHRGQERSALLFGLITLGPKIASALAVWLSFLVLAWVGYAPGRENSPEAIAGLGATYVFGPVLFVAAAGLCMVGYRLGAARCADIRVQLDALNDAGGRAEAT